MVSSNLQVIRQAPDCLPLRPCHSCHSRNCVQHTRSPHTLYETLSWGFVWPLSRVQGDTSLPGYPYRPVEVLKAIRNKKVF